MPRRIDLPQSNLPAPRDGDRGARWGLGDLGSVAGLIALTVYFLAISWRKWPDPLIDFGVVLYTPWRLTEGAVLYRDLDCFYGPFSQYFNAAVFAVFGTSLMTMVAVNLAIFAAILGMIYVCFRRAWGTLAAFIAGAVFVAVFGFSQYVAGGNYNYCTPYATETTHGMLVCLLLVAVLTRWVEQPGIRTSLLAGFLCGLTLVLKLEIMLAGGVVMLTALALRWWRHGRPPLAVWLAATGGAVLPSMAFFGYFMIHLPVGDALRAAGNGWLVAINGQLTSNTMQHGFLGFDQPWVHLVEHLKATGLALALLAGLGGAAWAGDRIGPRAWRYGLCALVAAGLVWFASYEVTWPEIGRCLLGTVLLYVATKVVMLLRAREPLPDPRGETLRVLLAVLAASLMARMALNGRIFHYGYYQAALAAILIPAVLIGEVGGWLRLKRGNVFMVAGTLALLTPGVVSLARHSNRVFKLKTLEVGEGADRFYALPKELAPATQLVRLALDFLRHQPPGQSVIVMPEGININYLSRRVSPVPNFLFYGPSTLNGREAKLVEKLRQHPPDWVFLVSVNLQENSIKRYGEKSGSGQELLQWLQEDYQRVAKTGGDPLDARDPGAQIFARKAALR